MRILSLCIHTCIYAYTEDSHRWLWSPSNQSGDTEDDFHGVQRRCFVFFFLVCIDWIPAPRKQFTGTEEEMDGVCVCVI